VDQSLGMWNYESIVDGIIYSCFTLGNWVENAMAGDVDEEEFGKTQ